MASVEIVLNYKGKSPIGDQGYPQSSLDSLS